VLVFLGSLYFLTPKKILGKNSANKHSLETHQLQLPSFTRNPKKFEMAKQLGATDCINPKDYDKPIQQVEIFDDNFLSGQIYNDQF